MLSIIIATYNSELTIRAALESVNNQSFQNWECVIVDGCSKDDTVKIVRDYELNDSRFRHISEPDKGVFDALNKGLKMAKGEWIYVLGSDDKLHLDAFEIVMKEKKEDAVVLYGDAIADYGNGKQRTIRTKPLFYMRYNMITSHQAMLVKREAMEQVGGFDLRYKLCADFDLFQKLYLSGAKFQYVKTPIAYYAMGGLSNDFSLRNDWDKYKVCKKNHSNTFPLFFFALDEMKWMLAKLRDKLI